MNKIFLSPAVSALFLAGMLSAHAQQKSIELSFTAQPVRYSIEGRPYKVTGYSTAHFGMTVDEVRATLATRYPQSLAALKDVTSPVSGNRALAIVVPQLAPGPGPATITYVFGATSLRLIAVNLHWLASGTATKTQQAQLAAGATTLASGFVGYQWPMFAVSRGHVIAPGTLVVFASRDADGGGVEVRLDGVEFDLEPRQMGTSAVFKTEHRALAPGPAQLRLSFVANVEKPDVLH